MHDLRNLGAVSVCAVVSNSPSALAVLTLLEIHHIVGTAGAAVLEGLTALPVAEVLSHVESRLGLLDFDDLAAGVLRAIDFHHRGRSAGVGGRGSRGFAGVGAISGLGGFRRRLRVFGDIHGHDGLRGLDAFHFRDVVVVCFVEKEVVKIAYRFQGA